MNILNGLLRFIPKKRVEVRTSSKALGMEGMLRFSPDVLKEFIGNPIMINITGDRVVMDGVAFGTLERVEEDSVDVLISSYRITKEFSITRSNDRTITASSINSHHVDLYVLDIMNGNAWLKVGLPK
jgi:hypothetical protein